MFFEDNLVDRLFSHQIQCLSSHLSLRLLSPLLQLFNQPHINLLFRRRLTSPHIVFNLNCFLSNEIIQETLLTHQIVVKLIILREQYTIILIFHRFLLLAFFFFIPLFLIFLLFLLFRCFILHFLLLACNLWLKLAFLQVLVNVKVKHLRIL
jgi:hypothetical protein